MCSVFEYSESQLPDKVFVEGKETSKFYTAFKVGWQYCRDAGVLRYQLKEQPSRLVQGIYSYILLLNPDRASKRRMPDVIDSLKKSFDPTKFNFGQVSEAEVVLRLRDAERAREEHTILVNVSPISPLHSLLCPFVHQNLPQMITQDSLRVALQVFFLAQNENLWIGFNSLCAMASVNHLHYHLLIEERVLPVEKLKCINLIGPLYVFEAAYPARAFCFQVANRSQINSTCRHVYKLVQYLTERDIAHNLVVRRGECVEGSGETVTRVAVWPRKNSCGAKQLDAFNVAVCELSGLLPVYEKETFKNLQASEIERELKFWTLEDLDELTENVIQLFKNDFELEKTT